MRRPILALAEVDGDTEWVLRQSGVPHQIAPPSRPNAICDAIVNLLKADRCSPRPEATDTDASEFTREAVAAHLAKSLSAVSIGHPVSDKILVKNSAVLGADANRDIIGKS